MILLVARLLGAFSSYGRSTRIAFALAVGLSLAFVPGGTLIWFIIFIPMMLIRINQAALLGAMAVGRLLMPLMDPAAEKLGFYLLNRPFMFDPMVRFLGIPMTGWLRLDDSFVIGSSIIGLLGWPLWFLICLILVILYRRFFAARIKKVFQGIGKKIPLLGKFGKLLSAARGVGGRS